MEFTPKPARCALALAFTLFAADASGQNIYRFEEGDPVSGASEEVPGPFTYNPLTAKSERNLRSFQSSGEAKVLPWPSVKGSVTIEAFVRPELVGGDADILRKTRQQESKAELGVGLVEIRNSNQTWHGGILAAPGKSPERWPAGHYSSTTRLQKDFDAWRHIAIVYDQNSGAVTCFVDYHLQSSRQVAGALAWDDSPFQVGGKFKGLIDEVRVTPRPLAPAEFLRARADSIQGVSFISDQQIAPRDAGCLDVKEHFGAAGDGRTDDTAAFNAAFAHLASKVPLAYNTLIIPAGTYVVSDSLYCSRFIDVKGAGPGKTIIRLRDKTFTDPAKPKPVLRMSSTKGDPGSHKGVNGSSISIYLDGVTIDTGSGNPGAKALEYHSNNLGRLENVVLRSGDGTGVLGLDLTHHDVGPALVKRVTVEGFDLGAAIRYQEYSMTLEHLTLKGQRVAGIRNQGNILAIRKLESANSVPAIVSEGANSMVTLLDSTLRCTGKDAKAAPAIRAEGGLYCLRVETPGYETAIHKRALTNQKPAEWKEETVPGPKIAEFVGDKIVTGFGNESGALKLPVDETPEPSLPPVSEWVSVARFSDGKQDGDASLAVQRAIDSGARVVYFPRDFRQEYKTPIRIRGKVERLMGFGGELQWAKSVWQPRNQAEQMDQSAAAPPLLIFENPDPKNTVVLDRLGCVHIQHASSGTLVLRSSSPRRYSTGTAGGRLFMEDIGGADWHFDHAQHVWARQWNPESHAAGPCIHSVGATIWALGFKTEYESQKWLAENGARSEILGAFIYPLGKIPADRPIFENRDSALSVIYGTSVYAANHKLHIRDTRKGETKEIGNDSLKWVGSRARMDLYISK